MGWVKKIINEEISSFMNEDEVAWQTNIYKHMSEASIPITKTISNILSDDVGERIKTFHITDLQGAINLKNISGSNKSISTFTCVSAFRLEGLEGVQTDGGILCEIIGDKIIEAPKDIYSKPDENGFRWVNPQSLLGWEGISNKWRDVVKKFKGSGSYEELKKRIGEYFTMADQFFMENKTEVIAALNTPEPSTDWNEVVVNNIYVNDVFWHGGNYEELESLGDPSTDEYQANWSKWRDDVFEKLNVIANGTVYDKQMGMTAQKFFSERGGSFSCKMNKIGAEYNEKEEATRGY